MPGQFMFRNRVYIYHSIKRLRTALKKGLNKHQEGRVLESWRACSRMEKSMFLNWGRGGLIIKYAFGLFISLHHDSLGSPFSHGGEFFFSRRGVLSRIEGISFSHRTHRFNRIFPPAFRVHKRVAPPQPLPRREGRSMWGYPYWPATWFLGSSFPHRTHRCNRAFPPAFRAHRTPSAYRYHRTLLLFSILIRDNTKPTSSP